MNPQEALDKHELTIKAEFVPFSQSRNKDEKNMSLNWKVTLLHKGREILTTDYSAGMGHCPAYKKIKSIFKMTWEEMELIKYECEKGKVAGFWGNALSSVMPPTEPKKRGDILPDAKDVIYSLLMDSEVIEYSGFDDWADTFGYDKDSRSAEKIYNACMTIALKFRQIGESTISELREAFQDY